MVKLNLELPEHFLEEEVREGYKISSDMKKVWAVELDLLNELDKVCKKYGLKYFADSGTLLGAVRHKGFIPWDDDIDVVMMRDDYEKFLEVAQGEFPSYMFLQTNATDIHYYRGHAQLRNSETAGMLKYEAKTVPFNQGIFIDVFPFDGVPFDKPCYKKWLKEKNRTLAKIKILQISYYKFNKSYFLKDVLKKVRQLICRLCANGLKEHKVFNDYMEICKKNPIEDCEYVEKVAFRYTNNFYHMKREWYKSAEYVDFENIKISIPVEYDKILTEMYGDWKKPSHAPTTHGDVILDAEKSYKEYLKEKFGNRNI